MLLNTHGNIVEPGVHHVIAPDSTTFGVYDTMMYVKPQKRTFVLGGVASTGVLLAAAGAKGYRYGFPNASVVVCPPRLNRQAYLAGEALTEARELMNTDKSYFDILAKHSGKDREYLRDAMKHNGYLYVDQAIQWGFLDKVVQKGQQLSGESSSAAISAMAASRAPSGGG